MYVIEIAAPTYKKIYSNEISVFRMGKDDYIHYLIVNSVEFGQNNSIDQMWIGGIRMICHCLIEFGQLIHGFVANQSFSHE